MPAAQVFPIAEDRPEVAALTEPVSIAVRAVHRARIDAGERVVVFGAGPIGQATAVAARERGASVLLVDRLERRLDLGRAAGAEAIAWTSHDEVVGLAREWAGDGGPPVVVDATGAPARDPRRRRHGRLGRARRHRRHGPGRRRASGRQLHREGARRPGHERAATATSSPRRSPSSSATATRLAPLVTHEFPLDRAPEALVFAMENPTEVMKVVIRGA